MEPRERLVRGTTGSNAWRATTGGRHDEAAGHPYGAGERGMVGNGSVEEPGRPAPVLAKAEYAN